MLLAVYPAIEEKSKEFGDKYAQRHNEKAQRGRVEKFIPIGTKVMKKVDVRGNKLQERWEGPFTVVKCNEQTKGYSLLDQTQELLNAEVPAARLKIIRGALDDKNKNPNTEVCEVDQIIGHRGDAGAR